ncbi:glycosyltransferase [Streptomyces sp. NPDC088794]|uniref:glycosyltransferase n=1 Tax=Streptomyces sp. NPDC088794 TaxID=3365902 RepID=UPI00381FD080
MRVLFSTVPLAGHFLPLAPLAWALRAAGHEVLVTTPDNFVPTVLGSGLPAASCGPSAEFTGLIRQEDLSAVPEGLVPQRYLHGRAFGRIAAGSAAGIAELAESWRPDLMICERAEFAGSLVAASRHVPWVQYHWSVAELPEYRHAAAEELSAAMTVSGVRELPRPAAVLDPWPAGLRLGHAAEHREIRHVPSHGDARVPGWLFGRRRRPRICLTFGTLLPQYGDGGLLGLMTALTHALAETGAELLVAVEDALAAQWKAPPAAVRHIGRLPLADAFPTCDVVVHHGGQGTSLTAMAAGRPQFVLPELDDQFDNARALEAAGAAVVLPMSAATPQTVAKGCLQLLEDDRYAEAASRLAAVTARMPAPSALVAPLEALALAGADR